ncbi:MAG: Fe-Mn family superoxide dismutase [Patescibacteria group bacterium]|nr:Fe-Mn family superoxide dismutase [Patescibacteria group bacterium]
MYEPKDFSHLLGLEGFSEALLKNHFTLYQGYVTNTNKLSDLLREHLAADRTATPEFAEAKRRFGWEFNGLRLHELYFGNLSKAPKSLDADSSLAKQLVKDFGTLQDWEKDFKATASLRGIGWVILTYDPIAKKTFNVWINEHDVGHLTGCLPLLVIDVFEHAFMLDYGLKRADYIAAFFRAIDWGSVQGRLK